MKKVLTMGMLAGLVGCGGCASMLATSLHNRDIEARAIQVRATPGGATVAVDLLKLKGYGGLWRDNPGLAAGAGLTDALLTGLALYAWNENQNNHSDTKQDTPSIWIQDNEGPVTVNTGNGSAKTEVAE